jgi:hypothetical protein
MISGINYLLIIIVSVLTLAIPFAHYRTGNKTLKIISIVISSLVLFYFSAITIAHLWLYGTNQNKVSYVLWFVSLFLSIACSFLSLKTIKSSITSNTLDLDN